LRHLEMLQGIASFAGIGDVRVAERVVMGCGEKAGR
jgi:hypothetical protein